MDTENYIIQEAGSSKGARDEIVRRCGDGENWTGVLRRLVPPEKGRDYLVLGAVEYEMIARGELPCPSSPLMVDGDLAVCGSDLRKLPRAVVRGGVDIADCERLEEVDIVCTGWLALVRCSSLRSVRGEAFGPAAIKSCPINQIGADFRAAGSLFIQMCRMMGSVNCEIGGGLEARGCGVIRTGPAFSAGKHLLVDQCEGFQGGGGTVGEWNISGFSTKQDRLYLDGAGEAAGIVRDGGIRKSSEKEKRRTRKGVGRGI
jgi:hypothetical protein